MPPKQTLVSRRGGLLHGVDAASNSGAGLRRLCAESAARLELLGAGLVMLAFAFCGAET